MAVSGGGSRIEAEVFLDVEEKYLDARASLTVVAQEAGRESLSWYLKSELNVDDVEGPRIAEWSYDYDPASLFGDYAKVLRVKLDGPTLEGERIRVDLAYGGELTAAFQKDWIELSLNMVWFPFDLGTGKQEYDVGVELDPEYAAQGTGLTSEGEGIWRLAPRGPVVDPCFVAARGLPVHKFEGEGLRVRVAAPGSVNGKQIEASGQACLEALAYFHKLLGPREWSEEVVLIVRPGLLGAPFARPGFLVINDDPNFGGGRLSPDAYRFLAHEVSHTWWNLGDYQGHDYWLSESFAEYSSLMAIRALFDPAEYASEIRTRTGVAAKLPALAGITRKNPAFDAVMNQKGSFLLHQLEAKIGEDAFRRLLARVARERVETTGAFLAVLAQISGDGDRNWFEALLKR